MTSGPDAYQRLVDQLLASPHYGERWARRWLDLARYSDTNGYEKDRPRTMWPYRDWVINAINADMPFDQFTIEQLAGDMLPDATDSQRIATGFHRNTMINEEGGIDPEEYRFLSLVDRVATTGTTWLGFTIGCARCHSHKYDPISQTEYYRMLALLNNANETTLKVKTQEITARRNALAKQIADLEDHLAQRFPLPDDNPGQLTNDQRRRQHLEERFAAWQAERASQAVAWTVLTPQDVKSNLASVDVLPDSSVLVSGDQTKNDIFTVTFQPSAQQVTAIRLEALPDGSLPEGGPGRRSAGQGASAGVGDFFLSRFTAAIANGEGSVKQLALNEASESFAAKDRSAALAIDDRGDTGWSIAGRPGERHVAVFRLSDPITLDAANCLQIRLEHESFYPSGLGRFRIAITADPRPIAASAIPDDVERVLRIEPRERSADQQARLRAYYLRVAPELEAEHKKIATLRSQMPSYPVTLVLEERPPRHARQTRFHHRGEYLGARDVVTPGVPDVLPPLPADRGADRLAFARWLVDRRNPLTARVVVNRHWQALFGTGLVRTTGDFGCRQLHLTRNCSIGWRSN